VRSLLHALVWLWTFPVSAWGSYNRKDQLADFEGRQVWVHKRWFRGYAHAAWPFIFVPRIGSRGNIKLMHHERFHIRQQLWFGPTWLPLYLVALVSAFIYGGANLKRTHRWNIFEVWARWHANRKMAEVEKAS
jgi:hypothetical protein